jgi:hypothetical protein
VSGGADRRALLLNQKDVTGIDFVNVHKQLQDTQATLDVHFLIPPGKLNGCSWRKSK